MATEVAVYSRFMVFRELADSLEQLGMTVREFATPAALRALLAASGPKLVLDVNFHPEVHAEAVGAGVAYAVWSFDSAVSEVMAANAGKFRSIDRFFLFNQGDSERARRWHDLVWHLPFSAGDGFIRSPRRDSFSADVLLLMNSYVETALQAEKDFAMTVAAAANDHLRDLLQLARALGDLAIERHLECFDRDCLDEFLAADIAACGVDPWGGNIAARRGFCRGLGQILSFRQREIGLRRLAELGVRVVVRGDDYWRPLAEAYPNVEYGGPAAYGDLPELYNRARIGVNLTQVQNLGSVPQRIYHLLAAGTLALSNGTACLGELFTLGRHLETFASPAEMCRKVQFLLENEDRRLEIAQAGHDEFMTNHRMADRLRFICSESGLPC